MYIDLHIHSVGSDGLATPKELVRTLVDGNVQVFAITDHDNLDSIAELEFCAKKADIRFIPGIEISVRSEPDMHIVGLGVDPNNRNLCNYCNESKLRIMWRIHKIITILTKYNLSYDLDELKRSKGRLDKESFSKVLSGCKNEDFTQISDLLNQVRLADKGKHPSLKSAIDLIHQSGGLAVYAHPFRGKKSTAQVFSEFEQCIVCGIDGVECFYPGCSGWESEFIIKLSNTHNLFLSGGSDWHGKSSYPAEKIDETQLTCLAGNIVRQLENKI